MATRPVGHQPTFADAPDVYDAVFGYRDIPRQVDFIEAVHKEFIGGEMRRVLDIACGTGEHAIELARRGYDVTGVDNSPKMLEHGRAKAGAAGLSVDFREGDMSGLELEGEFDCAVCMLHSLAYLPSNRELVQHFAGVSRVLGQHGVYVIEMGNPRAWLADPPRTRRERWDAGSWTETRDGLRIRATCYRDPIDYLTETARVEMVVDVTGRGASRRISDVSVQRLLLPQTVSALAAAGGRFRLAGYFGDFSLGQPLDDTSRSWRMIGAFTRLGKPSSGPTSAEPPSGQTTMSC